MVRVGTGRGRARRRSGLSSCCGDDGSASSSRFGLGEGVEMKADGRRFSFE